MTDLIGFAEDVLSKHEYVLQKISGMHKPTLLFENEIVLGFVLGYGSVSDLLESWRPDSETLIKENQLGLRRSMEKAWNSNLVLLCSEKASRLEQSLLDSIEEDLVGTRKIARAGISNLEETSRALLPLLPIQSAPNLTPINMEDEIRIRTTALPPEIMEAFFSTRDNSTIVQLLEEL